ncbi:MAG TPA: hypothetical protein VFF68_06350 [Anaerolineaceae bacterium]|nr:hypothetical protein [Anaerolineaceae bacterium]
MDEQLVCSLCGHHFSAEELSRSACPACPINKNCHLVCCPVCGNTDVNPAQSRLVQWVTQLFGGKTNELSQRGRELPVSDR